MDFIAEKEFAISIVTLAVSIISAVLLLITPHIISTPAVSRHLLVMTHHDNSQHQTVRVREKAS